MSHYFAYGSNMLVERLQARAPSAQPVSHARIDGWRLRFDKKSLDGSGKCHIERQPGACVHGVVFRIYDADLERLDQAEGVGHGYVREQLREVILGDGSKLRAFTYLAQDEAIQEGLPPYDWYRDLGIAGAEQHQLPADGIAPWRQIEAQPDPDLNRQARVQAMKLLKTYRDRPTGELFPYHRPASARVEAVPSLDHLSETTLYYPCCGRDWSDPLRLFGPWVRHLRFVDPNLRFRAGTNSGQLSKDKFPEWTFLHREVQGDPTQCTDLGAGPQVEERRPDFVPVTVSELYRHRPTGREVTLHWTKADGRKALDRFSDPLGVFFHRGDSGPCKDPGEGASGSHWLSKAWLTPVLHRLVNHGFIVTDGSCGEEYPELSRFHRDNTVDGARAVREAKDFTVDGLHFQCIGFAGPRYGPTLIWQVDKADGEGSFFQAPKNV